MARPAWCPFTHQSPRAFQPPTVVTPGRTARQGRTDMRTPRLAGLGLAATAAVAFAVTGCTADGNATPAASAPTADTPSASASAGNADPAAAAALAKAAAALGTP